MRRNRRIVASAFALSPTEYGAWNPRREIPLREFRERRERSRPLEVFLISAATLREVKAQKTPSASSDVGGVLIYRAEECEHTRSPAMRSGGSDRRITREQIPPLRSLSAGKGALCHARVDGNSDQCDRLCRLHRHRDLSQIDKRKIPGPLSARVQR